MYFTQFSHFGKFLNDTSSNFVNVYWIQTNDKTDSTHFRTLLFLPPSSSLFIVSFMCIYQEYFP
jgi:hypothetical protein